MPARAPACRRAEAVKPRGRNAEAVKPRGRNAEAAGRDHPDHLNSALEDLPHMATWKCAPVAAGGAAGATEGRPGAVGILTRGSHFCD